VKSITALVQSPLDLPSYNIRGEEGLLSLGFEYVQKDSSLQASKSTSTDLGEAEDDSDRPISLRHMQSGAIVTKRNFVSVCVVDFLVGSSET